MKRVLALSLAMLASGCGGGFDDMDAAREAMGGIGSSTVRPPVSSNPSSPGVSQSMWEYSEVSTSRFAQMRSLNTIPTDNQYNDAIMLVRIQNFINSSGVAKDYLNITVLFAGTDCAVNCQLRYKKNGSTSGVYRVRESVDGVFSENSFASGDMEKLIKAIKMSGKASITVPLDDGDAEFDFDFSGYDERYMSATR